MKVGRLLYKWRGFTLVETLAAFVILSLSLIVLFSAASGGVRSARRADFEGAAVPLCQSLLDGAGISWQISEGTTSGQFDNGFTWIMLATPYDPPIVREDSASKFRGEWLQLTVHGPQVASARGLSLTMTTMKLVPISQVRFATP